MNEEIRLKAFGFLQVDSSPSRLRELVKELDVPYSTLLKWRKELNAATKEGNVFSLINADQLMLHRVAEESRLELKKLAPEEGELIEAEVNDVINGVEGLQVLNKQLQTTAIKLARRVDSLTASTVYGKDIAILVDALTKLQIAFFNKTTNTINVQNNTYGDDSISKFKGLEKKV